MFETLKNKFNPDTTISFLQASKLKNSRYKGVQFTENESGEKNISNMDVFMDNTVNLQVELVKIFYSCTIEDINQLNSIEFEELYAPIEELDPLFLKKTI